jgi:hypothetical protein
MIGNQRHPRTPLHPLPLWERVAAMSAAKWTPGEGFFATDTDPSPGMIELSLDHATPSQKGRGCTAAGTTTFIHVIGER